MTKEELLTEEAKVRIQNRRLKERVKKDRKYALVLVHLMALLLVAYLHLLFMAF